MSKFALLGLCLGMILLTAFGFDQHSIFAYDRQWVMAGQFWRLLTAHFVHLGLLHLLLNIAALPVIAYFFYISSIPSSFVLGLIILGALLISVQMWFLSPEIVWYVGFSGVVHSLLMFVFVYLFNIQRGLSIIATSVLVLKVVLEQNHALAYLMGYLNHSVVYDAHLYGIIAGMVVYSGLYFCRSRC